MRRVVLLLFCCILSLLQLFSHEVEKNVFLDDASSVNPMLWSQAHVAILGDSNTWLGADDCSRLRGWNTWLTRLLKPASIRSFARSGATWTNTARTMPNLVQDTGRVADDNVVLNQILRLIHSVSTGQCSRPQLIIVAAGTNDAWFPALRPHALEADDSNSRLASGSALLPFDSLMARIVLPLPQTLVGSVRYGCSLLRVYLPEAKIVLLTPLQTTAVSFARIRQTGDSISAAAHRLSLPVVRQDSLCCVKRSEELKHHRYTYDGTHTNELGARMNARILARELTRLTGWR